VLTRNKGYRKPQKPTTVPPFFYRKYPHLRKAIRQRNALYNEQIDMVERLEAEGKLTVIRPIKPITVDRMERDTDKLLDLYNEGYNCAAEIDFIKG
jgi:predicted patatin/cPLA2 family phospholipase